MSHIPASTALSRFRVLDLSRVRAGPTCVKQLADFGADVIKIESPPGVDANEGMGGPRNGPDFQNLHRNKRSMTLNLKLPEGREIFARLAKKADVVVENYRPDVKYRLGLDYESLKAINPRIILASISGFGQDGPYLDRPGFDQIAQGMSGLMSVTGRPGEGPMRTGAAIADVSAGLYAALGILTALLEREASGQGQWVQSSLLMSGIALLDFQAARYLMEGEVPPQVGNDHPTSMPTSAYTTSDGHINIGASGEGMWKRLCPAVGRPDLLARAEFEGGANRAKNRKALN
ncbi:MAG: CoA transferase, partial [Betaproteobacteria bacterium]|nr:CoA transferase [Betaproteobacteria bacterium]